MTKAEAQQITAVLAAFYGVKDEDQMDAYAEYFAQEFDNAERLQDAVKGCIDHHTFLPRVADIRKVYNGPTLEQKYKQPELPEPDLTPEQRAENLKRARELVERYSLPSVEGGE